MRKLAINLRIYQLLLPDSRPKSVQIRKAEFSLELR